MKKYKILALAMFACVTLNGWAQSEDNVTGRVLDKEGKPVAGALVSVEENPLVRVATDKNGRFEIIAVKGNRLKVQTGDDATKVVKVNGGSELTVVMDYSSEKVNYGFGLQQTNAESTGAVSTVYAEDIDKVRLFNREFLIWQCVGTDYHAKYRCGMGTDAVNVYSRTEDTEWQ